MNSNRSTSDPSKHSIALRVAQISGAFCLLVSVLLILNFWQMNSANPLESQALDLLVERLKSEPNNQELMQEIRYLDLLARRAYFSSIWGIRVGGYLLLAGAIVLVLSLRLYFRYTFSIAKPSGDEEEAFTPRDKALKWLLGVGAAIMLVAFILAITATNPLEPKPIGANQVTMPQTIEVVEITDGNAPLATDSAVITPETTTIGTTVTEVDAVAAMPAVTPTFPSEREINRQHNAFRGPWGQGVSHSSNIPTRWDGTTGENIRWRVNVPIHGYSSPVIWGDKLFLTGATQQKREVLCYNRLTGQLLWRREANNIPGSPATPPRTTDDTGLAAPSPTTDGQRVYAIFGTGDIIALDMDGNRIWARNLGVPDNHYGHSSSLLVYENQLFVQYDTRTRGRIIALNVLDGTTIWENTRTSDISWAPPMLAKVNGQFQLIIKGNPNVTGHAINDGRVLWTARCMSGEVGPSPAFANNTVIAANEHARMVAINPTSGQILWETNYYLPEVASPVIKDGLVIIGTTYSLIACFDASSGQLVWEFDSQNGFYSSPMLVGNRVYISDRDGITYILEVSRTLNVLAKNPLGEGIYSTPAFADGAIYFRGKDTLYCIGGR